MIHKLTLTLATLALSCGAAWGQMSPGQTTTSSQASANTSTLTTGTATSLTAGQYIGSSGAIPSFTINNSGGAAIIPKFVLMNNVTSGWTGATTYIELWSSAPTMTNADGGTYAVTSGSANFLGAYSCIFGSTSGSATFGQAADGAYAECVPVQGTVGIPKLPSGTAIYWTMAATSSVTKASGSVFKLTPMSALN